MPASSCTDELRKIYVEITTDCNPDCGMCIRHAWEDPAGTMAVETFEALLEKVRRFEFSPCIDCGGCELPESNEGDCFANGFPLLRRMPLGRWTGPVPVNRIG